MRPPSLESLPLRFQVFGAFFLLQAVVLIGSFAALHRMERNLVDAELEKALASALATADEHLDQVMERIGGRVRKTNESPGQWTRFREVHRTQAEGRFFARLKSRIGADHLFVLDREGRILSATTGKTAPDPSARDLPPIRQAINGREARGTHAYMGRLWDIIAVPAPDPERLVLAAFLGQDERRARRISKIAGIPIALSDGKSVVVSAMESGLQEAFQSELPTFLPERLGVFDVAGERYATHSRPISETVRIHVMTSWDKVAGPLGRLKRYLVLLGALSLSLSILLGYLIARGITAAIQALVDRLRDSNAKLDDLNRFKDRFFAMVAHDLQNPLSSILGYAEFLEKDPKNARVPEWAGVLRRSAEILGFLTADLVDFTAMESGKLRMKIDAMDLSEVVRDVERVLSFKAAHRQVAFSIDGLPAALPMRGDPRRLAQLLQNLCSNAIQYTPIGGSVSVSLRPGASEVEIAVRDTGIGIAPEDLPRIFGEFFQAKNATQMRAGGFGLGLSIVQEIVKAHGGRIAVESVLGRGSVFTVRLPTGTRQALSDQVV
ncbi:MAG: HAMP domain-containing histidine kinase [Elusimicrobia bacterium]|nr:HAMP domain-containing histidine kinase [Elusimicrobiota bacterium]